MCRSASVFGARLERAPSLVNPSLRALEQFDAMIVQLLAGRDRGLAGAGARLDITIDIQATKPDGFDESEVRTIGENARVLKFDPSSGFEKS